ncbi:unnamed protein product [Adineta steineri]|uniref:Uncharacterized protein n=1 Tax=Adineta steineri TaxID=433720 RepID=A0A814FP45_9BILA|nr:unnamed protein product [Adineta steineri]CAF4132051.1 unnamed protein product [Adineta steineri]
MDKIELRIFYNDHSRPDYRTKSTWSFTNTTTKQEFDDFIRSWIDSDELKDYDIQYKDPTNGNKNTLDKNQPNFLAPVFRCATILSGVHSLTSADRFVNIFIEPILQDDEDQINASSSATCDLQSLLSPILQSEFEEFLEYVQLRGEDCVSQENGSYSFDYHDQINTSSFDTRDEQPLIPPDSQPDCVTFWQNFQQRREDYVSQENDSCNFDYQGDAASAEFIHRSAEHNMDINPPMHTTSNNADLGVKHIRMIHDVSPQPGRWRYFSDGAPKRSAQERKSVAKRSHALLSGVKGPEQKNQHIRPIISIPFFIRELIKSGASVVLWIAGVTEEKIGNERVWRLHLHSEFRQPGCSAESIGVNPIDMVLNQKSVQHGQFTIEVILTKKLGLIGTNSKGLILHRLDEDSVQKLHVAEHNNKLIRIAFILSIDGLRDINTFGLSGFMDFTPKHKSDQISVQPKICRECNQPIKRKRPAKKRSTAYSDSDSGMTEE